RSENLRVCVFVPPSSVEFNLLIGSDVKLASGRSL
ncbi:siroheme synthase, partial [Vibrio fortis]